MGTILPHNEIRESICVFCTCGKTWLGALPEPDAPYEVERRQADEQVASICRVVAALHMVAGISTEKLIRDNFVFLDMKTVYLFIQVIEQYIDDLHIYPLTDPEISIYQIWQDMEHELDAERARRDVAPKETETERAAGEVYTTLLNFFLPNDAFYASYLVHSYCLSSDVNARMRAAIEEFLNSDAGKMELREGESFTWHDALEQVSAEVFARHGIICFHPVQASVETNWDENLGAR